MEIILDICKTVETISYFAKTNDDQMLTENYHNLISIKVMTDTEITMDLLLETIMLPLVNLCIDK